MPGFRDNSGWRGTCASTCRPEQTVREKRGKDQNGGILIGIITVSQKVTVTAKVNVATGILSDYLPERRYVPD